MEVFLDWIRQRGCSFAGIEVRMCDDDSGYGVFALRSFRINETLITLPPQLMITAGMVAELPYYKQLLERSVHKCSSLLIFVFFSYMFRPFLSLSPFHPSSLSSLSSFHFPDFL